VTGIVPEPYTACQGKCTTCRLHLPIERRCRIILT
jgi:hypothetical protein